MEEGIKLSDNIYRRNINGNEMSCLLQRNFIFYKTVTKEHCNIKGLLNSSHSLLAIDLTPDLTTELNVLKKEILFKIR